MSWENALRDAERWIQTLDLPKPIKGSVIQLDLYADSLQFEGNYKIIVLRAAKRLLEKRGVEVYLIEPEA